MPDGEGPCYTWPIDPDCSCLPEDRTEWTQQIRSAIETATEILWHLTGQRYGLCRRIIRPCRPKCRRPLGAPEGPVPVIIDGRWYNVSACGCGCGCAPERCDDCDCGAGPDRITLPGPVYVPRIGACPPGDYPMQVWVDGQVLDPENYWVEPPNALVRLDGDKWPHCQNTAAPYDGEGAFAVDYWQGIPVPPGGKRAVSVLACEIHKACIKDSSCALPARVKEVDREGITYTMIDPLEFLGQGRTGLTEVDMWVAAVNPTGARTPARVLSPDLVRHRPQGIHPTGRSTW